MTWFISVWKNGDLVRTESEDIEEEDPASHGGTSPDEVLKVENKAPHDEDGADWSWSGREAGEEGVDEK